MHNRNGAIVILPNQPPLVAAYVARVEQPRPGIVGKLNLPGRRRGPVRAGRASCGHAASRVVLVGMAAPSTLISARSTGRFIPPLAAAARRL